MDATKKKKRGRPPGSRTHYMTPAMRRAREYIHALEGMKPSEAARAVAEKWGVVESTVFHDARRHVNRLIADDKARTRAAYIDVAHMVRRVQPAVAAMIEEEISRQFKTTLAKRLGVDPLDQVISDYEIETELGDQWLVIVGMLHLAALNTENIQSR